MATNTTVSWECPNCGYRNVDVKEQTPYPFCGDCDQVNSWKNILADPNTNVEVEEYEE